MSNFTLTGGGNTVADYVDEVFRYDASTFYSADQDNLPIFDLEDRTNFNYFLLGAPLSGNVSGWTYTLSSATDASRNIFTNIEDIVDRLPVRITQPFRIEIAKFGNLGELNLEGISFTGSGTLAIDNLLFGHEGTLLIAKGAAAGSMKSIAGFPDRDGSTTTREHIISATAVEWATQLTTNAPLNRFVATVPYTGAGLSSNYRSFINAFPDNNSRADVPAMLMVSVADAATDRISNDHGNHDTANDSFYLSGYSSLRDASISGWDFQYKEGEGWSNTYLESSYTEWAPASEIGMGLIFANYFTKVKVRNCGGSNKHIIFRGVLVDGATETVATPNVLSHDTVDGWTIENTNGLYLMHCGAFRCKETGFKVLNSDVSISGEWLGTRIYDLSVHPDNGIHYRKSQGTGVLAVNSKIHYPTQSDPEGDTTHEQRSYPTIFSHVGNGMHLINSYLDGGKYNVLSGAAPGADGDPQTSRIVIFKNTGDALKVDNSVVDFRGQVMLFNNYRGLVAEGSKVALHQFLIENNYQEGIKSTNSQVYYGRNQLHQEGVGANFSIFHATRNGVDISLKGGSVFKPYYFGLSTPYRHHFGSFGAIVANPYSHGSTGQNRGADKPSVVVDNSYCELLHFACGTQMPDVGSYGAIAYVDNGGYLVFRGTGTHKTTLGCTPDFSNGAFANTGELIVGQHMAGVYARNGSIIEFTGPTKIMQFGVGALAEDNSIIRFNPPYDESRSTVDHQVWDLGELHNHTQVDLHSTRAGLVAKGRSKLCLEFLGDGEYAPNTGTLDTGFKPYQDLSSVRGGYFQFYPNPYHAMAFPYSNCVTLADEAGATTAQNLPITTLSSINQRNASLGGMCVRVLEDSEIEVNHVNFPMGIDPVELSGPIYDASTNCWRPHIWNIADTSRIKAFNVAVSGQFDGMHGLGSNYHGPSGAWYSPKEGVLGEDRPAELDWYGLSGARIRSNDVENRQANGYYNHGPFRLYFSVDGVLKNYATTGSEGGGNGDVIQAIAQGYTLSSRTVSAFNVQNQTYSWNYSISANQPWILSSNLSSYFGSRNGYLRNFLDETAVEAFANARQLSEPHLKMISIFRPSSGDSGLGDGGEPPVGNGAGVRSVNNFDLGRTN